MRYTTELDPCPACLFSWTMDREEALGLVRQSPPRYVRALMVRNPRLSTRPGVWSPCEYLWHMVDVLRIGTERLWTLTLEPTIGVPCWDENELARVRSYANLSVPVGLRAHARAVEEWVTAAEEAPAGVETAHPELGTITALDVIRRIAHETKHHLVDIERGAKATG
ncbi:MAG: DinB family protein [Acidimicrobiales bacterium]|jgi:hypothetical protein